MTPALTPNRPASALLAAGGRGGRGSAAGDMTEEAAGSIMEACWLQESKNDHHRQGRDRQRARSKSAEEWGPPDLQISMTDHMDPMHGRSTGCSRSVSSSPTPLFRCRPTTQSAAARQGRAEAAPRVSSGAGVTSQWVSFTSRLTSTWPSVLSAKAREGDADDCRVADAMVAPAGADSPARGRSIDQNDAGSSRCSPIRAARLPALGGAIVTSQDRDRDHRRARPMTRAPPSTTSGTSAPTRRR